LVEIMIVVGIVAILSFLAAFVIREDQAKGRPFPAPKRPPPALPSKGILLHRDRRRRISRRGTAFINEGYLKQSIEDRLFGSGSLETKMGWHYGRRFVAGEPTYAYQGAQPTAGNPPAIAEYYPGQPTSYATVFPATGGQSTTTTTTTTSPAQAPAVPQPPSGSKAGASPNAPWVPTTVVKLPPSAKIRPARLLRLNSFNSSAPARPIPTIHPA